MINQEEKQGNGSEWKNALDEWKNLESPKKIAKGNWKWKMCQMNVYQL